MILEPFRFSKFIGSVKEKTYIGFFARWKYILYWFYYAVELGRVMAIGSLLPPLLSSRNKTVPNMWMQASKKKDFYLHLTSSSFIPTSSLYISVPVPPSIVVESRPWLGATLCSYISWHQPLLIVDFVFAMNNARLASFNLHYIVGSEKKTPDPRQTPSENSGYGDLVYTHEISYSSILLLSLFSLWLNNTLYSINKLV